MAEPHASVTPIAYAVSCLPLDDINASNFTIYVRRRALNSWAVLLRDTWCLSREGTWHTEPIPSERTDEWKAQHRFPLEEALRLAREMAPKIEVGKWTVTDALARAKEAPGD